MPEQMQHGTADDEISLMDILRILKQYKWLLLAAPVFCAVVALAVVSQIRPIWEASALIQVGQVGQAGQQVQLIEPISRAVARIMAPPFKLGVFNRPEIKSSEILSEQPIYMGSFKAKAVPDTDMIELKLRAHSNEMAKNLLLATGKQLCETHGEMMGLSVDSLKQQVMETEKTLRAGQDTANELRQRLSNDKVGAAGVVLYVTLYQQTMNELRETEQRKRMLEEQMRPERTYLTKMVGDVYTENQPVSQKKGVIVFLAALMGLLGGGIAALLHNAIKKKTKI